MQASEMRIRGDEWPKFRKQPEELSSYERKYLAMLEEILPRPIS